MPGSEHICRLELTIDADEVLLTLSGDFDARGRLQLRLLVRKLLVRGHERVAVDVGQLTRIDAAGLGALLRADLLLRSVGSVLFVQNAGPAFLEKLRTTGLERRLTVAPTAVAH